MRGVFRLRRFGIKLKRSKWAILRWGLGVPGYQIVALGQRLLSKQLLLSCEVAMEYLLALTHSPQVPLVCSAGVGLGKSRVPKPLEVCHHQMVGALIHSPTSLVWGFRLIQHAGVQRVVTTSSGQNESTLLLSSCRDGMPLGNC